MLIKIINLNQIFVISKGEDPTDQERQNLDAKIIAGQDKYKQTLYGVQLGLLNNFPNIRFRGLAIGLWNNNWSMRGVGVGLSNRTLTDMDGVQVGFINSSIGIGYPYEYGRIVDGNMRGIQIATINFAGNMYGVQAGLGNFSNRDMTGAQISLLENFSGRDMTGVQIALLNDTGRNMTGVQIAAFVNNTGHEEEYEEYDDSGFTFTEGNMRGIQIATMNFAGNMYGVQAGARNISDRDTIGAQIAVLNDAGRNTGAQIGVSNDAGRNTGAQIGVSNDAGRNTGVQIGLSKHPIVQEVLDNVRRGYKWLKSFVVQSFGSTE